MTTEHERLRAWMERNSHSAETLRQALGYSISLANLIDGKRPFPEIFRFTFGKRFGNEALRQVFEIDLGDDRSLFQDYTYERLWLAKRYAAHGALKLGLAHKQLLPAKHYKCHGCDKQAQQYHHESYRPEDHLCVVPLCITCHRRHHTGRKPLAFGVVPTSVGLVRIATSTPALTPASQ